MRLLFKLGISLGIALALAASGAHATQPEGIVLALTPSQDPTALQEHGKAFAEALAKLIGVPIKIYIAWTSRKGICGLRLCRGDRGLKE